MSYYHDLITEKSWQKLQELRKEYRFILIGGWAVYLYTKGLKSRDIDFICDYDELQKFKADHELIKNERLKKYEIHAGEFDIDIYVPFFSDLGIPVEDLIKMSHSIQGFTVLKAESLLLLKQKAYRDRAASAKGEKDRLDIIALLYSGSIDVAIYKGLIKKYRLEGYDKDIKEILLSTREAPQLSVGEHAFSQFKKKLLKLF